MQITAAVTNGCASRRRSQLHQTNQMNDDLLQALRNRTPIETDPKLDTLAKFTLAVINTKRRVGDEALANFWKLATRSKMPWMWFSVLVLPVFATIPTT